VKFFWKQGSLFLTKPVSAPLEGFLMNAALYRHARTHTKAVVALARDHAAYEWLIDYDLKVFDGESSFVLRPDVAGLDRGTKEVRVAVEVSDSTLGYDMAEKRALYATAGVEWYVVIDCKGGQLFVYQNAGRRLVESSGSHPFGGLMEIFKD
jgi:Uma2 family endonuclease